MKFVFILQKSNAFKYYGPLINKLVNHNHYVELWYYNCEDPKGYKFYLSPLNLKIKNNILNNKKKLIKRFFTDKNKISDQIIQDSASIDFFFSLFFINNFFYNINSIFIKSIKSKWCVIMHGLDSFTQFKSDFLNYEYEPIFFSYSKNLYKFGLQWLQRYHNKRKFNFNNFLNNIRVFHVGNLSLTSEYLKNQNKFNRNKLIYLPFPYLPERYSKNSFAFQAAFSGRDIIYGNFSHNFFKNIIHKTLVYFEVLINFKKTFNYFFKYNELAVIKSLRIFCDSNNLEFVVKPRKKFPFIKILRNIADRVIEDDESKQYPSILQEELKSAKIVVGILSYSFFESSFFRVPYINIKVPDMAFLDKDDKAFYDYRNYTPNNFDKVVSAVKIETFISDFKNQSINNFITNDIQFDKYLKIYSGINNKIEPFDKVYKILKKI
jgi:hypothetical protein